MRLSLLLSALLLVLGLPAAYGGGTSDPGVTPDTILLGATVPLTGDEVAYAAVARGADAYFKYVNARGGVRKRRIQYLYLDDGYNPAETLRKTRQLVQDEHVFAIFNSVGTEHALAVRPYLNQNGVPQLFVGSGLSALALEHKTYPWSMGYLPRFAGEAAVYGRYLARTRPRAKIAVLHENSEYGEDMFAGLRRGLGRLSTRIVGVQTYDVTDPALSRDPGVKLYKQILRRYLPSAKVKEVAHLYGMAVAYTMVDALRAAGAQPTRRSLLRAATSLNERSNPF